MTKYLLLIFLCLPTIGVGQGCMYGGSIDDASELCNFYQGNSFASDRSADIALEKILSVIGISKRFVVLPCDDIDNCVAVSYKGIRYILYDKGFMSEISNSTNSWSNISILAHEIGHHVNGHSVDLVVYATNSVDPPSLAQSREEELEADEFSGFIMYKLGASLSQAQEAVGLISKYGDDTYSTHPSKDKRFKAIEDGYNKAKSQGPNSNESYTTNSYTLPAEDYYYKAIDYDQRGEYQLAIDDYTRAIAIDPDFAKAYHNRGNAKQRLRNYGDAISDYTRAIAIDPDYALAYYNRGGSLSKLENYNDAISDITRAIAIDPDFALSYYLRGFAHGELGYHRAAISDYTRAIAIDPDYVDAYINRGIEKGKLGNYNDAISDFTRAIAIDPDEGGAYFNRGAAKLILGRLDCRDLRKACDLGEGCEEYYRLCK